MDKIKQMREMDAERKMQRIKAVKKMSEVMHDVSLDKVMLLKLADALSVEVETLEIMIQSLRVVSIVDLTLLSVKSRDKK
tara:strand:- start:536 stop:775 length:240 start_codon:yes stop_codon:yes gene_type:complete